MAKYSHDMAEIPPVFGEPDPVEYAELAVATNSPLLLIGGPGVGKTMLARRMITIIPAGESTEPPFRAPHHTISQAALLGPIRGAKGYGFAPEIDLAKGGILFLDELDEFAAPRDPALLARRLQQPDAPLIVGSINAHVVMGPGGRQMYPTGHDFLQKALARVEGGWFRFPLKLYMSPVSLSDMRAHYGGRDPDRSLANPRSSASIRARIAAYDPAAREIAHDLVEEGRIAEAWRILRGHVVERINPALTKQGVIDLFKQTIKEPGVHALEVAQDLLAEQEITLAEASASEETTLGETRSDHFLDLFASGTFTVLDEPEGQYAKADKMVGSATRQRLVWMGPHVIRVNWHVTPLKGDLGRSLHPSTDTGYHCEWQIVARGSVQGAEPDRTNFSTRDEAIHYAVKFAWVLVKLIKLVLERDAKAGMDAFIAAIENFFWARRDGEVQEDCFTLNQPPTPPELIDRVFGRTVKNPRGGHMRNPAAMTRWQADEYFGELLLEPGTHSLVVAQDWLEEQSMTLLDVSMVQSKGEHGLMRGRFTLQVEPRVEVDWQVLPSGTSGYPGRGWHALTWIVHYGDKKWRDERSGSWQNITFLDEALYRAVEHAWFIVKVMKRVGLDAPWQEMQHEIEGRGLAPRSVVEEPVTPPWLIAPYGEHRRPRGNPGGSPMPSSSAVRRYTGFHQKDPKRIGHFDRRLVIPAEAQLIGDAVHVLYKSDKLNPTTGEDEGWIDYIHEHDAGVKVYRCDAKAGGPAGVTRRVPEWLQRADDLVWLGQCNGFCFEDDDGEHEVKATRPYPELFCTPNGKALLVIQGKRTLLAMIWGGRLGVEPRGIVH